MASSSQRVPTWFLDRFKGWRSQRVDFQERVGGGFAKGADGREKGRGKRWTVCACVSGRSIEVVFEVDFGGVFGRKSNKEGGALAGGGGWNLRGWEPVVEGEKGVGLLEASGGGEHGKDARHGLYRMRVYEDISSLPVTNIYGHFDHLLEANYRRSLGYPGLKPQGGPFCSTLFSH